MSSLRIPCEPHDKQFPLNHACTQIKDFLPNWFIPADVRAGIGKETNIGSPHLGFLLRVHSWKFTVFSLYF